MKSNSYKSLLFLMLIMLTQSCSTYSRKECENFDWNERGYLSALEGKTEDQALSHYHATCSKDYKVEINFKEFEVGYQKGLQAFCVPDNALNFGNRGGAYQGTCPQDKESGFLNKYTAGFNQFLKLRVEELEKDNGLLQSRISDLESKNSRLEGEVSRLSLQSCP